jgi:hypothetical protein
MCVSELGSTEVYRGEILGRSWKERDSIPMSVSEEKRKENREKAETLLRELTNVSGMLQITVEKYGSTREKPYLWSPKQKVDDLRFNSIISHHLISLPPCCRCWCCWFPSAPLPPRIR